MKIKVGIIGLGYWGPNYVRNFIRHPSVEVTWVCDISEIALQKIKNEYLSIPTTTTSDDLLNDPTLDVIAIATPPATHFSLAKKSLEKKKHVFIAKPLATSLADARKLTYIAKKNNKILFTDLTYLYTDAIQFIQKEIAKQKIGTPLYYDSVRSNLGIIQKDVNVIWDLAPHDLGIIDMLFHKMPKTVFATATAFSQNQQEEMAHITLTYPNNFIAHIHISWLSPVKLRTILIGGTKKMIYFNDVEQDEKIKIYNKGLRDKNMLITPFQPLFRSGDISIPRLKNEEALAKEVTYFLSLIKTNKPNIENMAMNLRIIKILEACDISLATGKPVKVT